MMKSWFLRRTDKNAEEQVVPVHSCARQNTEEFANSHTVRVDTLRTAVGPTKLCCPGTSGLVGGCCVWLSPLPLWTQLHLASLLVQRNSHSSLCASST